MKKLEHLWLRDKKLSLLFSKVAEEITSTVEDVGNFNILVYLAVENHVVGMWESKQRFWKIRASSTHVWELCQGVEGGKETIYKAISRFIAVTLLFEVIPQFGKMTCCLV